MPNFIDQFVAALGCGSFRTNRVWVHYEVHLFFLFLVLLVPLSFGVAVGFWVWGFLLSLEFFPDAGRGAVPSFFFPLPLLPLLRLFGFGVFSASGRRGSLSSKGGDNVPYDPGFWVFSFGGTSCFSWLSLAILVSVFPVSLPIPRLGWLSFGLDGLWGCLCSSDS